MIRLWKPRKKKRLEDMKMAEAGRRGKGVLFLLFLYKSW